MMIFFNRTFIALTHLIFSAITYELIVDTSWLNRINKIENHLCVADALILETFYARHFAGTLQLLIDPSNNFFLDGCVSGICQLRENRQSV